MTPSPHQTTGNQATGGTHRAGDNHKHPSSVNELKSGAPESETSDGGTGAGKESSAASSNEAAAKLALELKQFSAIASNLRSELTPAASFAERCMQAFDIANDLFSNAPTWVCFYRELMGGAGMLRELFAESKDMSAFLRTDQHQQIQGMLTALRSRDLPESDPNDPQRMITVRLPKSLHEAMCEEAIRLNISVNRLCISRMLQLLDPAMIPETGSRPRGRKPRARSKPAAAQATTARKAEPAPPTSQRSEASRDFERFPTISRP